MENKIVRSVRVNKNLWNKIKVHCAKVPTTISDYIEKLIKKDLEQ